jgi:endoglucanase
MKPAARGSSSFSFAVLLACLIAMALSASSFAGDVELIVNGDFSSGQAPWWTAGTSATVSGGVLTADVPATAVNPWDAIVGQSGIPVASGVSYTLRFDAWASTPANVRTVVQLAVAPYTAYFAADVALSTSPQTFSYTFTSGVDDPAAVLQFLVGANGAYQVSLDNVSLSRPGASAPPSRIGELVRNGTFGDGTTDPWWATSSASLAAAEGRLQATITSGGANPWDVIVGQSGIPVFATGSYTLTLKAWASANVVAHVSLQQSGPPYAEFFGSDLALTANPKVFTFTFTSSGEDPAASLQLKLGGQGEFVFYLDNVSLNGPQPVSAMPITQLVGNGGFDGALAPWWTSNVSGDVSAGFLQATIVNAGTNPWDAIIGQNGVAVVAGGHYTLSFKAWASQDVTVRVLIQKNGPPYTGYFFSFIDLTPSPQTFSFNFTSSFDDPLATLQFQIGGQGPFVVSLDDVSLLGPKPAPPTQFLTIVRANQTGYLTRAPKHATVAVDVTTPLPWTLYDEGDNPVASGTTTVFGPDAASGERLQLLDFTDVRRPGSGYTLEVYGERSFPFAIGDDVYTRLKYDALAYFYQSRSGIPITMPFAGADQWTRAAGHLSVPPNQGDLAVPCFDRVDTLGTPWTGCDYTLDATKGWYDAGDHGKYVVNGGIAVWTLLDEYERAKYEAPLDRWAFRDGRLNIPENANGVPDILDEARFELEFLLSMQVPPDGKVEGQSLGGMVHHKLHDANWTAIPLAPADDPEPRFLYPPSTAATLNLAAVAAQCARVFHSIDDAFARRCLRAAETAWTAALAHPAMYARNNFTGGGPYDDADVSDEFYWAAAELFVTTGKPQYYRFLTRSPHFLEVPGAVEPNGVVKGSAMGWPTTQALGTISLALVPSKLPWWQVAQARHNILRIADGYATAASLEPYGLPYSSATGYYWGSNSAVLNNMLILGLAYDFSGRDRYLRAVSSGMDYILGRNPNVKSFVSGYGQRALENPTHHFWAHEADASFPGPPPGAVAGGPNAQLEDPFAASALVGCAPQKCYIDDIASYSTNEIAINWNAPLAWAAAFLDGARELRGRSWRH